MAKDYVITTFHGGIYCVIDTSADYFQKTRKVYLDDFLFKDSLYDKKMGISIQKYIACDSPIIIGYKTMPKTLVSKRGKYKLTKECYDEVKSAMQANEFFDYETGDLIYKEMKVYEPKDLEDFKKCEAELVGTQFINDLTEKAMLLYEENDTLVSKHLNETDLEYQKYTLSLEEISTYTFISEHNYEVFYKFMNK